MIACVTGCASAPPSARVRYALASPDVGEAWHLHAKDGTLVCELPCEAEVGENSGDYLVVHEPKVWRVNLPNALPTDPGGSVRMEARVGKGSPALATLGYALGIVGAGAAAAGLGAGVYDFVHGFRAVDDNVLAAAGVLLGVGAILGVVGVYLTDHNQGASAHIVVTPTSFGGSF